MMRRGVLLALVAISCAAAGAPPQAASNDLVVARRALGDGNWYTAERRALAAAAVFAEGGLPPWRDPTVNSINRLGARAVVVPCESRDTAIAIAKGEKPRDASRWLESLNGAWDFKWKHNVDAPGWEKSAKIAVPGC